MIQKTTLATENLLNDPLLNKGTAFTKKEKELFHLHGLLPYESETIDTQLVRCREAFNAKDSMLEKHIYLRSLQDRNEVLFYRFILEHITEMMPIIYTPGVGDACKYFNHIYRQARGLFISYPEREKMDEIFKHIAKTRDVKVIVVTDGERILGLGDQGIGGLGIPIGKLSLYTLCGGIHPANTLPIILDVGTNNEDRLKDPEYFGVKKHRITGKKYDDFLETFVVAVKKHFPNVLLQFEDFAQQHAFPLLERYRNRLCSFNDDIQGTAAVTTAAIAAAVKITEIPLRHHRIAVLGAGSAGCGISNQLVRAMANQGLSEEEACSQFYIVDRFGLIHTGMKNILDFQRPLAQDKAILSNWTIENPNNVTLKDIIQNAKPTILLGVSGQPNQFTEDMVKEMMTYCKRPIILPLSNPTSRAEAVPSDLLQWSSGAALVATGSPFNPVSINGETIEVAQCNNAYIFPGMGLAVVAGQIKRVTNKMMMAAALALAEQAPALKTGVGRLLPELSCIRDVSRHIAKAVIIEAINEGHAKPMSEKNIDKAIDKTQWYPDYEALSP